MKKKRFLILGLLALFTMSNAFIACSKDNDGEEQTRKPDVNNGSDDKIDPVVTGGMENLTSRSVVVFGYVNSNNPQSISEMGIIYGTDSEKSKLAANGIKITAQAFDSGTDSKRFSIQLTGLSTSTTYYYYAFADQNIANNVLNFTTQKPNPSCPDENHPHAIDLALPSGTKWSCCNVGAKTVLESGGYYAWGETSAKKNFTWKTYKHGSSNSNVYDIGSDIAGTKYDAATANWGATWCIPTQAQCKELIDYCTSVWTGLNGKNGRIFVGENGNAIFIPAAGHYWSDEIVYGTVRGCYWSSTLNDDYPNFGRVLSFGNTGNAYIDNQDRCDGLNIRPVRKN